MILSLLFISSIPLINFEKAKEEIQRNAHLIYERFEFHNQFRYQFFLGASNLSKKTWDLMKYKFALKAIDAIRLQKNSTFIMIFGGSSVTAGHDNYFNQSYPNIVFKRFSSSLAALGIELVVNNIAQGANQCRPSNLCYESMGLENFDWVGWEQSYNCPKSNDIFEMVARLALMNSAIVYYSASGSFLPDDCNKSTDSILWTSEEWTPESVGIQREIQLNRQFINTTKHLLDTWYHHGNSAARFTNPLYDEYDGAGPHGFSIWSHTKDICVNEYFNTSFSCDTYNMRGPCYEQGGLHWMVYESSLYGQDSGNGAKW